ncbi:XylR N-terminal domain-containing protein [Alteribacillus sp. JSM 102045]|uniref:XylR N-terminal domain-containing protein n=1 Tax=Alteribacillus sp. JSM 102045 TaxID=1562101 RepID=UPI0035C17240
MKANRLMLNDLMEVNPRTGVITLNNKRMALMSVQALGILRRDLVDTLSMERAKGFLMRYGRACGQKAAEDLEQTYKWESTEELMLAGPALHTLEGVVTVEAENIEYNDDTLHYTGYWRNSFEVEEHLYHYGESKTPVCWILVGYASGFLTKLFGKQVLVHEEKCKGKGDPYCYFVAKTFDPADKKQQADLRYYEAESLISELDRSYKEIKELNENIIESERVQKKLTDLLLEDESLSSMLEVVSAALHKSIIIDYRYGKNEGVFLEEEAFIEENLLENPNNLIDNQKMMEMYPIHAKGKNLGNMIVIGEEKNKKKEELIIQRALTICSIKIFHAFQLIQSKWQKKEEFFEELLNSEKDEETLQIGSHVFEFNSQNDNRVLTILVDDKESNELILEHLNSKYTALDIFLKDKYIILILSEDYNKNLENFAKDLQASIENKFKKSITYIGVGRAVKGLKKLAKSYQDASRICDFLQLVHPNDSHISYFEELEPIVLLLKATDQEDLIDFCKKMIGDLIEYDKENQSNLLITLKSYLDNNGNLQKTANDLHLSIAGLRYRLDKIESFGKKGLKTGSGRFKYQLAINMYFSMQIMDNSSNIL